MSIGTTITDMVVDYINQHKPDNMSKSWKVVCCATHTRKLVQAQPNSKRAVKTTKPVTLPPFSTTVVKGNTKFKSHGMRLNLIAESPNGTQLPSGKLLKHCKSFALSLQYWLMLTSRLLLFSTLMPVEMYWVQYCTKSRMGKRES